MYNCYYHPKVEGSNTCKGCKLPICLGCESELGFCPDCMGKRNAVAQLRQMRGAVAEKAKAGSTTARLRLAIRQAGIGRPAASNAAAQPKPVRSQMLTRPLPALEPQQPVARPEPTPRPIVAVPKGHQRVPEGSAPFRGPLPAAARKAVRRRATGTLNWKYAPEKLAYRAPENMHEVAANRRANKAPKQAPVIQVDAALKRSWAPAAAIAAGVIFLAGLLFTHLPGHVEAAPDNSHPLYTPLSHAEQALVTKTLAAAPVQRHVIDLPDATFDGRTQAAAPAPAAPVPPVQVQSFTQPQAPAPVAVARVAPPAFHPSHHVVHRAAPVIAYVAPPAPRRSAARAAYQPRPQVVRQRGSSLADAMHFSGWTNGAAHPGHTSTIETAHW